MKHGSLFSGIGGFDLASEWIGWENIFHCEWNEFGQKVLKYYWPDAESFTDITKTDFRKYANKIDILTGGFPCQPYSAAGKRLGKEDDRHLWPEMLRAIREIKPKWVVAENVLGIVSWNGGLVFNEVQVDLENEGYEVQPFILPACGKNAPHKRERVWFIAFNSDSSTGKQIQNMEGQNRERISRVIEKRIFQKTYNKSNRFGKVSSKKRIITHTTMCNQQRHRIRKEQQKRKIRRPGAGIDRKRIIADMHNTRLQGSKNKGGIRKSNENENKQPSGFFQPDWEKFPTESPICNRNDGISSGLVGITFPKWRNESIKAMGNAIVPQIAYEIFKVIDKMNPTH